MRLLLRGSKEAQIGTTLAYVAMFAGPCWMSLLNGEARLLSDEFDVPRGLRLWHLRLSAETPQG